VTVDGSRATDRALTRAIRFARDSRGRLGILATIPSIGPGLALPPVSVCVAGLQQELEAEAIRYVEEAVLAVPREIPVTKLVVHGKLVRAVASQARTGRWDLAVVGCGMWLDGGPCWRALAAWLARSSTVPVLLVGRERDDRPAISGAELSSLVDSYAPQPI
jgi:nucleotide-binding universal stress UspA family protein